MAETLGKLVHICQENLLTSRQVCTIFRYMSMNDEFLVRWRVRRVQAHKSAGGYVKFSPSSKRWQNVHVKAVRKVDVTKGCATDNSRYLINKDSRSIRSGKEDLVGIIGNPTEFSKKIAGDYDHYRIILSPKRGDLLDMTAFVKNVVKEVEIEIGIRIGQEDHTMDYAAVIHKPAKPNSAGIYNQHAHLIIRGGYGKGASWLVPMFREAAAREATRQVEFGIGAKVFELDKSREIIMTMHNDKVNRND